MIEHTYFLAENSTANYLILQDCISQYPAIEEERRIKTAYKKSDGDILDDDGGLLVPQDSTPYFYAKCTADELAILEQISVYSTYTINTQPFSTYWI